MANRFTETRKWNDIWFRKLTPEGKLLFFYLVENCDLAGFIEFDEESAEHHTGMSVDQIRKALIDVEKCYIQKEGWYWIKKFIRYQKNASLNPSNNAHKKILSLLSEQLVRFTKEDFEEYLGAIQGLNSPPGSSISNGIVEVKVERRFSFDEIWGKYPRREGKKAAEKHFNASVKTEQDWINIQNALKTYVQSEPVKEELAKGSVKYIKQGSTWFNNWRDYIPEKPPEDKIDLDAIRKERGERL